ncbi:MAG: nucleotidyltransferase domain-containing protein [Deltaproteobacteria bacterium]|nr:nucleotidyltransferase domain-containing protein [Deltaproteobacteria bacterium]
MLGKKVFTIAAIKDLVTPIAREYGVRRMWIFGSYARGEASEKSDIDFRIDRGDIDNYIRLACFYGALEKILSKYIDILTITQLYDKFLENISLEEGIIYDIVI